jgi:membrane fusion protein, multidrug efflux system
VRTPKSVWPSAKLAFLACLAAALPTHAQTPATAPDAVRGIVRAFEQAMISTDLQTRAKKINFQEGERFKKGDVLIEFDCGKQRAELAASEAQLLEMTLTLDKFRVLQRAQAAGKNDIEIAEARVAKATAETSGLKSHIDHCILVAPYGGRVLELTVHPLESPQPGKPFIGIVADNQLEIDLIVPSEWARWLKVGEPFAFAVDELTVTHDVTVVRIGAAVDPISQTIKIVGVFKGSTGSVLPGMSGTAHFARVGG